MKQNKNHLEGLRKGLNQKNEEINRVAKYPYDEHNLLVFFSGVKGVLSFCVYVSLFSFTCWPANLFLGPLDFPTDKVIQQYPLTHSNAILPEYD